MKLTREDKCRILTLLFDGLSQKTVANVFQCHRNTIGAVWKTRHDIVIQARIQAN